jgi:hypothetical protein
VRFSQVREARINLSRCETYAVRILASPASVVLDESVLYEFTLRGNNRATIETTADLSNALLVDSLFNNLKLSSDTLFDFVTSFETTMSLVDLSEVRVFREEELRKMKATSTTIQPATMQRPAIWPEYRPAAKDDGI